MNTVMNAKEYVAGGRSRETKNKNYIEWQSTLKTVVSPF